MKKFFIPVAVLLLIGMFLAGFFYAKIKYITHYAALPKTVPAEMQNNPVNVYKDSSGITHYTYNSYQNSITKNEALKQSSPLIPYIDSVASALNAKQKQLESSTVITTNTVADSTKFLKKQIDSLKRLVFFYHDKYLNLTVRSGNPTDTLDNGSFDFAYNADLNINQYWKRKKILGLNIGSKQHFTDISSNDPRTTIGGLKTLTVKQNFPSIGFRLQALTNYNFYTHSVSPGIGFRFDLKRFSLNGIYYYNTQQASWRPVLSFRYDIIQL